MSEEEKTIADPRDALKLKLAEPDVSAEQTWNDDVLGREEIAGRLTNLIQNQSDPFTLSIHGNWGTGKTFLLKRWQKDLENKSFRAIYFNAWEDDFSDDPLLAILGQLSDHFKEGALKTIAKEAPKIALPLLRRNASSVLNRGTGLTLDTDQKEQRNLVDEYLDQRKTKEELKKHLAEISAEVVKETGHPMVFIIDELDRCRPTFAIELLERVKHIFDVPHLVFIFGINRDELCSSLKSIYGNIEADVYLRRFFDMEFTLPEVDSAEFARHRREQFGLIEFFGTFNDRSQDFNNLGTDFPKLWRSIGLSLRDIDYCIRSIAFVGRNLELRRSMYPWLLGTLITLKLQNPSLYRRFVQGSCRASEVIDYIDTQLSSHPFDEDLERVLDRIEAQLYAAESSNVYWRFH